MNSFYRDIIKGLNEALEHAKGAKKLRNHKVAVKPVNKPRLVAQSDFTAIPNVSQKTNKYWKTEPDT